MDATLSCDGDGEVFTLLPDSTLCDNVWLWQLPCSLSAGQSVTIGWDELLDTLWRDGSAPLQWAWKGTDEHNLLVNPGPYLAVVEWVEHLTGRRGVDRCMVAVAPGQ